MSVSVGVGVSVGVFEDEEEDMLGMVVLLKARCCWCVGRGVILFRHGRGE